MPKLRVIAAINNSVSAELFRQDILAQNIPLNETIVILLRDLHEKWLEDCGVVLRYPGRPADTILGQRRFIRFYFLAARMLRRIDEANEITHIYVVNNDNLITSHLLIMAEQKEGIITSVLTEGLMNFQIIGKENRNKWRWLLKPSIATLLGFSYRIPNSHLSGSFEEVVSRVVSFSAEGLKAPPEKVVVRSLSQIKPLRRTDPTVALVALTGLANWMPREKADLFARAFFNWIQKQGFRKLQVKRHPRVSAGLIEDLLSSYDEVGKGHSLEAIAVEMDAGTIIGTCCTALVTLKLMRPDLICIDYGSDYYCENAYHGDTSVQQLFRKTGVKTIQIGEE